MRLHFKDINLLYGTFPQRSRPYSWLSPLASPLQQCAAERYGKPAEIKYKSRSAYQHFYKHNAYRKLLILLGTLLKTVHCELYSCGNSEMEPMQYVMHITYWESLSLLTVTNPLKRNYSVSHFCDNGNQYRWCPGGWNLKCVRCVWLYLPTDVWIPDTDSKSCGYPKGPIISSNLSAHYAEYSSGSLKKQAIWKRARCKSQHIPIYFLPL